MRYQFNLNYNLNNIIDFEDYIKMEFPSLEYTTYYNDLNIIDLNFLNEINIEELSTLIENYTNPTIEEKTIKNIGMNFTTSETPYFKTIYSFDYGSTKTQTIQELIINSFCIPKTLTLNENDYYAIRLVNISKNKIVNTINLKNINNTQDIMDTPNCSCFKSFNFEIQVKCLQPCKVIIQNISMVIT
jgi:hypothetical protein